MLVVALLADVLAPQSPTTAKAAEFLRPYRGFQEINIRSHFGTSNYDALQLHIQQRQQGIATGNDIPVLPPMTVHVLGVMIEPGQSGKLEGTLTTGTYGVVCRRDAPSGRSEAIYVRGPFQVN